VPGIGRKSFFNCLRTQKESEVGDLDFWEGRTGLWQKALLSKAQESSIKKFKKANSFYSYYQSLLDSGIQALTFEEAAYPQLLKNSDDFPPVLFIKSKEKISKNLLEKYFANALAVVGTRQMTAYGRLVLKELIPDLLASGMTIVSGFMYGVDLEAQKLAIKNKGKTVAVLGYGFDYSYPKKHRFLLEEYLEQGAIFMTEFAPNVAPKAGNFVQRNRIVAALSLGTLVVEAATKSGSHITADFANQYGRLVFAVPGPITNEYSKGTKDLINKGAVMVTEAADILREIQADYHLNFLQENLQRAKKVSQAKQNNSLSKDSRENLLAVLSNRAISSFSQLLEDTNLSNDQLNQLLFDLEISGQIANKMGNYCLL
jgi:DNA processing protein